MKLFESAADVRNLDHGFEADGEFVVVGGSCPIMLGSVEAAFDDVTGPAGRRPMAVHHGSLWSSGYRLGPFHRNGGRDVSAAQLGPVGPGGMGIVR